MPPEEQPGGVVAAPASAGGFQVHLDNFSGPFDLLLSLISRHRLDITEVALAQVTDEFIAAVRHAEDSDSPWGLGHLSEFLVVAATLLDLKAARLLPATDVEDAEDLEMLEARDLLFARLLQYRAFKEVAAGIGARLAEQAGACRGWSASSRTWPPCCPSWCCGSARTSSPCWQRARCSPGRTSRESTWATSTRPW